MKKFLLSVLLGMCLSAPAYASGSEWLMYSNSGEALHDVYYASFFLEGNALELRGKHVSGFLGGASVTPWNPICTTRTPRIYWDVFSEYKTQGAVVLYGKWAVCGTVANNQWTPDPYAQFVITAPGSGYVSWSPDTPSGYTANLVIGGAFEGSDAPEIPIYLYGDIVGYDRATCYTYSYMSYCWNTPSHTFNVAYTSPVPEPSGIICLVAGMGSLFGLRKLRSR